jgi:FkbM family methyltransferase
MKIIPNSRKLSDVVVIKCLYYCRTLDSICIENTVEVVHFLKVDVEGAEKKVFEGFSFS